MKLSFQDPTYPQSEYLLESVVESSLEATTGGGAFAFASTGGVKLLLEDGTFQKFLSRSAFDLVVGVDAVTNIPALNRLNACMVKHPNLSVRVFLSDTKNGLFHPKFCWFRSPKNSIFLVGSGNLTVGGLRGNREAFSISKVDTRNSRQPHEAWSSWIAMNEERLLAPCHPDVLRRAEKNRGTEFGRRFKNEPIIEDIAGKIIVGTPQIGNAVLLAEIPKSGNRWNQANFDLETFQNYFGATPGHTQRIILTSINDEGKPGEEEIRPSVAVSSHNFRFELEAASGLAYPLKVVQSVCLFVLQRGHSGIGFSCQEQSPTALQTPS
jgi:hypothetical protein